MVKLVQVGESQYMVTVPQELRKAIGWEKGDDLSWEVESDDCLRLKSGD